MGTDHTHRYTGSLDNTENLIGKDETGFIETPHKALDPISLDTLKGSFKDTSYYSTGRTWDDYKAAYLYGEETQARYRGVRFAEAELSLSQGWEEARGQSRLTWPEAREAVREAWNLIYQQQRRGHPPRD